MISGRDNAIPFHIVNGGEVGSWDVGICRSPVPHLSGNVKRCLVKNPSPAVAHIVSMTFFGVTLYVWPAPVQRNGVRARSEYTTAPSAGSIMA